jgi:hypothetical protein
VIDVKRKIVTQQPVCASVPEADGINAAIMTWPTGGGGGKMSDKDSDAVADFIRSKGVTRCPTACVLPTQGSIAAANRIALEQHAIARDRMQRERAAARWRSFSAVNCSDDRYGETCEVLPSSS